MISIEKPIGVQRIFDEAREQGLPEPGITAIATGLRFTLYLRESVSVKTASEPAQKAATGQAPCK